MSETNPQPNPQTVNPRAPLASIPVIAVRDLELVQRLAVDLQAAARALQRGDTKALRAMNRNFLKFPREAERVRYILRRASRGRLPEEKAAPDA